MGKYKGVGTYNARRKRPAHWRKRRMRNVLAESSTRNINDVFISNQEDIAMAEKIHKVTVPCKCRLCLTEITSSATPIWGDSGIHDMVLRCSGVNVLETDEFQFVCLRCKRHLDCANKFQQMCLKSNEIFLKITSIKKEDPFSDSLNQHEFKIEPLDGEEIKIEPWNEDDYELEDFHFHEDEDTFETATKLDSEGEREEEYLCEECPMISYTEDDHLIHLKSHKEKSKICSRIDLCPICGKVLLIKHRYLKHIRLHTRPHQSKKCDECGKMLSSNDSLREHKRCHQPKVLFDCTLCGCKLTKKSLQRHMESVHNQLPSSCPFCGRKFSCRYNLTVHLRTHTGEMPYSCPDCGISFAHRVTMKLHRLKEHKVNMFDPPTQKEGIKRKRRKANTNNNLASEFEG